MQLIAVSSRALRAVGYDGHTLAVMFTTSDTVYLYPGVPEWVYLDLMAADSMGAYYNRFIRGRYR